MEVDWMCHLSRNGIWMNVSSESKWQWAECVIWARAEVGWMCHLSQNGCWLNAWFEPEWQLTMLGVSAYCLCVCNLGPAHFFAWGIVSDPVAQFLWRWWLPVIFHLRWRGLHSVDVSFWHIWGSFLIFFIPFILFLPPPPPPPLFFSSSFFPPSKRGHFLYVLVCVHPKVHYSVTFPHHVRLVVVFTPPPLFFFKSTKQFLCFIISWSHICNLCLLWTIMCSTIWSSMFSGVCVFSIRWSTFYFLQTFAWPFMEN